MFRLSILTATALAASGSVALASPAPTPDRYPVDYDVQVRARLEMTLKDYGSAIIKVTRPPRATMMNVYDKMFGKPVPAHVACYTINAKNSYGGYVGFRPHAFAFVDGRMVNAWEYREARSPLDESAISKECLLPADPAPAAAPTGEQGQPSSTVEP